MRPGNDFSWSSWNNVDSAVLEIDGILNSISEGSCAALRDMRFLTVPTGPLQELAMSSSWAEEFEQLAQQIELELERLAETCNCLELGPTCGSTIQELGTDDRWWEWSLIDCLRCRQVWIKAIHENEAFTASGQWYMVPIESRLVEAVSIESAKESLNGSSRILSGGSYFQGIKRWIDGPVGF